MTLPTLLLTNLAVILGCMVLLWLISLPLRNASIVDIFWGPGFAVVSLVTLLLVEDAGPRQWLLAAITSAWGLRLGIYLALRNIGHGEDPRYAAWRQRVTDAGGNYAVVSLPRVFVLQGVLIVFVSLPVQVGQLAPGGDTLGPLAYLGALAWLTGFLFEAIGDWQLRRFKAEPANRGKVMDRGLWRYTRHPNYFGNACLWWGIWLVACDGPGAVWTLVGPLLMTFFLLKVSGVSLLEKSLVETKPGYADYIRRTSAFLPRPPKD